MMKVIFPLIAKSIYRDTYLLVWSVLLPLGLFIGLGIYHESVAYRENLLVGCILVSLVMGAINTSGFWIMTQRRRGVFKLLKLSSLPISKFFFYSMLARLIVFEVITVLLLLTGMLLFGMTFNLTAVGMLLGLTLVGLVCFNSFGFMIASRASNEGMMNMMTSVTSMLFIFLSSTFYSLDNAPKWIQMLSKINPVEYASRIGKNAIAGDVALQYSLIFILIASICSLIAVKTFRYE